MPSTLTRFPFLEPVMSDAPQHTHTVLGRGSWPETKRVAEILSKETIGGMLLLAGALLGIIWANTP